MQLASSILIWAAIIMLIDAAIGFYFNESLNKKFGLHVDIVRIARWEALTAITLALVGILFTL